MIAEDAFRGWKHNLSSIEIAKGYKEIARNAFLDSWKLKTYIIPASVKTIGKHAIGYEYDEKTGKYKKIDGVKIICFAGSAAEKYAIDNGFEYEATDDRFSYRENSDGTVTITGCKNCSAEITLPSKYYQKKVVAIADGAFKSGSEDSLDKIEKVIIPEGIKKIGSSAFEDCDGLKEVVFPGTLTDIGENAFRYCGSLTKATLKKGLKTIGNKAFYGCDLETITSIPSSVTFIGADAFTNTPRSKSELKKGPFVIIDGFLIQYDNDARNHNVIIPSDVKYICGRSFVENNRIHSLTVPSSVKYIGEQAVSTCGGLQTLIIEEGVETVADHAFSFCRSYGDEATYLNTIKLPASLKNIGTHAFGYGVYNKPTYEERLNTKSGDDITIYCPKGSAAEKYAKNNKINVEYTYNDPVRLS